MANILAEFKTNIQR